MEDESAAIGRLRNSQLPIGQIASKSVDASGELRMPHRGVGLPAASTMGKTRLLTAHCSLLTAHCSLLTAHCSLLTANSRSDQR